MREEICICNQCGKEIGLKEDAFCGRKEWGYFSGKDLECHEFFLCEDCYNKITEQFCIPVTIKTVQEVL